MGKRRRERDRPKAGPDSLYNPSKRVLLSYASDDGEEEVPESPDEHSDGGQGGLDDVHTANYEMQEYPDEVEDAQPGEGDEESGHGEEIEIAEDTVKRSTPHARKRNEEPWKREVRKNQSTNQYPSLGLTAFAHDEENEEDEYDSTTEDAMAYLKSVRLERLGMPEILTASSHLRSSTGADVDGGRNQNNDADAYEGYYYRDEDEAFIGPPTAAPVAEGEMQDPQTIYTKALVSRFLTQRQQLRVPPTVEALTALGSSDLISFPQGNNKAYAEWHRLLSSKPPKLAQLQSLEQDTVSALLALIQKHILVRGRQIKTVTSSWVWSLLARLEDVGSMTNDQVYPLRELGKKAIIIQLSIVDPEVATQLEALDQSGSGDFLPGDDGGACFKHDHEAADQEAGSGGEHDRKSNNEADSDDISIANTKATLDMILVVVGEVFGQRDLLEFRQPWAVREKPQVR